MKKLEVTIKAVVSYHPFPSEKMNRRARTKIKSALRDALEDKCSFIDIDAQDEDGSYSAATSGSQFRIVEAKEL